MKKLLKTLVAALAMAVSAAYAAPMTFGVTVNAAQPDAMNVSQSSYQHFVAALSKQMKTPVKLEVFANQTKLVNAVSAGKVDLAFVKVVPFITAQMQKKNIQPLATVLTWNDNKTHKVNMYASYIVTLASNKSINKISDLTNKKFGFARESASGFYFPSYYLQKKNIAYTYHFYNNQYDTLWALKHNDVQAAALWNANFNLSKDKLKLKNIEAIGQIPNPVIIAGGKLSAAQQADVKKALMALPSTAYTGLAFAGVQNFNQGLYATATKIIKTVKGPAS